MIAVIRRRPCRDRLLANDLEEANLSHSVEVSAAAEFAREVAHLDHADHVRILLSKEGHCAVGLGLLDWHQRRVYRCSREDPLVDGVFDRSESFATDCLGVAKIETKPVGLDLASGLLRVLAQDGSQCVMQQVSRCMGTADRIAPLGVNLGVHLLLHGDLTFSDLSDVDDELVFFLGIVHTKRKPVAPDRTRVAHLTAGLAVEGGSVEDQRDRGPAVGLGRLG